MNYDARKDGFDSYNAAVAAKRAALLRERSPSAKRVEVIGQCELYLGDCMEIMPGIGRVHAVVTDPPYGIGRDGKPPSTSSHGGHKGYEFKGWDKSAPPSEAFEAIQSISDVQIIWGANYFPKALEPSMGWLFWDKGQRIDQSDGELAYTNLPRALRVFTLNRAAIAKDGAVHPTQKPLQLMQWCLSFLPGAGPCLDPFMGSGTTGVACAKRARPFIGIEIDEGYFDIACRRIEDAYRQADMFSAPAPAAPQAEQFGLMLDVTTKTKGISE